MARRNGRNEQERFYLVIGEGDGARVEYETPQLPVLASPDLAHTEQEPVLANVGAVEEEPLYEAPVGQDAGAGLSLDAYADVEPVDVKPRRTIDSVLAEDLEDDDMYDERPGMPLWLDLLLTACMTIALVVLMRTFVLDTYVVPSGSMLDTIQLNDRLFGEKVSYRFRSPAAGEVVTFLDPVDPGTILIKRVIATGGQQVDLVDGVVYVDGQPLDEPYVQGKPSEPIASHASTIDAPLSYPYVIPDGYVWVMGDNRTNSLDSRYFGPIPVASVSAHALFIFWPLSDIGTL